jgi:hypothetical protein
MRTSEVLRRLAATPGDRLDVATILSNLGDKAFAFLIVILGVPNCIPMPPPIPIVCGFLLIAVSAQIAFGRKSPWAPKILLSRSVLQKDVARATDRAMPFVLQMERISRPRLQWFAPSLANMLVALLLFALSLGIITAAPFIGQIPWGVAVCLMGLGLVEQDGILVIAALIAALFGAFLSAGFVYAIIVAVSSWF